MFIKLIDQKSLWDKNLNWYEGKFNQVEWIVEDLVNGLKDKKSNT